MRDVDYGKAGDYALKLDLYRGTPRAPGAAPALVMIHGGGWKAWPDGTWDKTADQGLARAFAKHGYVVAAIDYRLAGVAPFPAALQDCRRAVRWIRSHAAEYGVDRGHIGLWGFSAGAHLALLAGSTEETSGPDGRAEPTAISSRVQAISSWAGPTDFTDRTGKRKLVGELEELVRAFIGGSYDERSEEYRRASPALQVSRNAPPTLLVHGDEDPLVPYSHSEVMLEKLNAAGAQATLLRVRGGGHLLFKEEGQDPPLRGMVQATLGFFDHHLKKPKILFFTHSAGFLHDVVKRPSSEAPSLAEEQLREASKGVFDLVLSQDPREVGPERLKNYQAVVFYTSGELPIDREALLSYVREGGGFVCVHNAMATLMKYPPYSEMVGASFDGHPWNQEITVKVEDREHPSTVQLGDTFRIKDEIYQVKDWERKNVHVLMSVEPSSVDLSKGKRADGDYALAWTKSFGKGKVFYTALGHYPEVWKDERFLKHLVGGIHWVLPDPK